MTIQSDKSYRLVRVLGAAQGEGKFIRQAGPPGHYGHVVMVVEPSTDDGLTFVWSVGEAAIPERFSQAVMRGIDLTFAEAGQFHGCTFTLTRVRIIDGSYHEIDSRERSFEIASALAFANAVQRAGGVAEFS